MAQVLTRNNVIQSVVRELQLFDEIIFNTNPPYARRHRDIIRMIDLYYMSRYRDGEYDNLGQKKVFYNISVLPVEVAAKMMDIDTKNIELKSEDGESYWPSWIKGKELNWWMKEKYFGRELNLYSHNLAKYGHLFVKKVGSDVMVVNPNNIIVRPDVEKLEETPILEYHKLKIDSFYALADARGWENFKLSPSEEALGEVEFYEAFFPEGFFKGPKNYFVVVLLPPGGNSNKREGKVIVDISIDPPYKAMPFERIPGRFLGRGQIEKLFEDQIYLNRLANYKAEGLHWTSKHIYQTRDVTIGANNLSQTDNGDILLIKSEVVPVQNEERNLQVYSYEERRWEDMAFKKAFTQEPVTGARAPSGTPLGSTILQAQMTAGYYDQKKEDLGSFVEEIIWDWVLPEFEKENRKAHKIMVQNLITGGDEHSNNFFNMLLSGKMNKKRLEMLQKGKMMSQDQYEIIKGIQAEILSKEDFEIPKNFYENLKHTIRIDIVGEHMDTPAKLSTLQILLQMLSSNPGIFQDKRIRKIIYKTLELAGFNPHDFDIEETPDIASSTQQVVAQRGGSISVPTPGNLPITLPQTANAA